MTIAAKKRAADREATGPNKKKQQTSDSKDDGAEALEDYHVQAKLHSDFDIFPVELRRSLQRLYEEDMRTQMDILSSGKRVVQGHNNCVMFEKRARQHTPAHGSTMRIIKDNISGLSLANTTLLKWVLHSFKSDADSPTFIKQSSIEGLPNPAYNYTHAVRHGEVGWGADCNGCLSFYAVQMNAGKVDEISTYVKRTPIKIEEDS